MSSFTLPQIAGKILVVGSIYDQIDKLIAINKIRLNYQYVVLIGNICYPAGDINDRMIKVNAACSQSNILYCLGKHDLLHGQQVIQNKDYETLKWFSKPNIVSVEFISQTRVLIMDGGLTPNMNLESIKDTMEVSFVSKIDNQPWHESYNGLLGYVISNNPPSNEHPNFYNYSAQIGNSYSSNCNVYAQEIEQYGLQDTFLI